ncbi:unnamed protein product [Tetraodon nigroviridis]|uniref:(spotted green pufferfish) hypothetical protein n=1 Tax=Tetraodon nigroviridis TaxID=99883 RepID=Q4TAE0_TETNG|nr:unnamed protein product [Tetraodon nigroviridis]
MAKQVEQLEKEKKELQERLKNQEKKIDYFERAKRLEEIPLIKKAYEEQRISNMKVEREKALEHKKRMSRMMEDKENFLSKITAARSFIYKEKLKAFEERLVEERKKRLEDRRKQRKEERRNAYYRQKEEEAQRIREEQLKKDKRTQKELHGETSNELYQEVFELTAAQGNPAVVTLDNLIRILTVVTKTDAADEYVLSAPGLGPVLQSILENGERALQ